MPPMRLHLALAFLTLASCGHAVHVKTESAKESMRLTQRDADDVTVGLFATEIKQRFGEPFAVVTDPAKSYARWLYDAEHDGGLDFVLSIDVQNGRVVGVQKP